MNFNEKNKIILNKDIYNSIKDYKFNYKNKNREIINNENEILKLKKIIEEKDNIILELHLKLKEFRKNIDLLKNKMIYISENTQPKELYNNDNLQIQIIQRFNILSNLPINYNYEQNLNTIESFSNKEIINKSRNNLSQYFDNVGKNTYHEVKTKPYLKLKSLKDYKSIENNNSGYLSKSSKNFYKNNEKDLNNLKYNSSLFFQKCKVLMNYEEYLELLRIIKLFNAKKISKSQTYEHITNYLQKINPKLLKEFYSLCIQ